MSYTQLTQEERYQIYALKKAGHIQAEIAEIVGCDAVTQGLYSAQRPGVHPDL